LYPRAHETVVSFTKERRQIKKSLEMSNLDDEQLTFIKELSHDPDSRIAEALLKKSAEADGRICCRG
jgi:hypothetical protein